MQRVFRLPCLALNAGLLCQLSKRHIAHSCRIQRARTCTRTCTRSNSSSSSASHAAPIFPMSGEIIEYLAPQKDKVYLDGTFGEGGYTKRILDEAACHVVAIDQDPCAVTRRVGWPSLERSFDGIVLDIGLSSSQLASDRGFSFQRDCPLDMRMSSTAAHGSLRRLIPADVVVNQFSGDKLNSIFKQFGQERFSRLIVKEIEKRRAKAPIMTTHQLVDAVVAASLRIYVNDELGQLQSALASATRMLNPGGRLVVVMHRQEHFRALAEEQPAKLLFEEDEYEDAAVTDTETETETDTEIYSDAGTVPCVFRLVTKRVVRPSAEEIERNPRSRSAKLRTIERVK
ncbi:MraW methylase family-domain-containing protein [Kickxella alabastrina]|uniref:MraW methylase family-domain-containing protein n=1 Tax=Kickxella alabastrina TaxID=61397 RepID=UPI00221E64FF|nr:MraW methylase family-domain-containing protein [Kickxella alabastrina]KAI7825581.1 MraW methylase family-domain-containing protein [Kickxella alabastrina]